MIHPHYTFKFVLIRIGPRSLSLLHHTLPLGLGFRVQGSGFRVQGLGFPLSTLLSSLFSRSLLFPLSSLLCPLPLRFFHHTGFLPFVLFFLAFVLIFFPFFERDRVPRRKKGGNWFDHDENVGTTISITMDPMDLSSRSLILLPRFIRARRPTPLLDPSLVLFPPSSV